MDILLMEVMKPPYSWRPSYARYAVALPELVLAYLDSRDWHRRQQADELERMAGMLYSQALLARVEPNQAQAFVEPVLARVAALRDPEVPPEFEPLPLDLMLVLRGQSQLQDDIATGRYTPPE